MIASALLAFATAATPPAAAPPPAPATDITITASKLTPEEVHARAVDFVRKTGVAFGEESAARWAEPVCPRTIGLTDAGAAALVVAKFREVAGDAGIATAAAPCAPNVLIIFAADGGAVVRGMVERFPRRLAMLRPAMVKTLTDGTAPIRWWHSSEIFDKDDLLGAGTATPRIAGAGVQQQDDGTVQTVNRYSNSLISTGSARALRAATIVVDITRTDGLPLSAVAAYAAMVALAEIRPGPAPPDSVLGLFAGGPVLRSPSAWDIAFLRALYRLPLDRTALSQRGRLIGDLAAEQTRGPTRR